MAKRRVSVPASRTRNGRPNGKTCARSMTEGVPRLGIRQKSGGSFDEYSQHKVDAISGATRTTQGVEGMLQFWLGENGYLPYLRRLQQERLVMRQNYWQILTRPLIEDNPLTLQILGICSALAVTTTLDTALLMSVVVIAVLAIGSGLVSLIRHQLPRSVRIIVQITIIASLVIVVDQIMQAFAFELSKRLSIFVGLVITNCIVLGRAEGYAMHNGVLASVLDGIGNGLGYAMILIIVGTIRELLGRGSIFNIQVLIPVSQGGGFEPLQLMLLPPSAFFIIGGIIWFIRSRRPRQVEKPEFDLRPKDQASQ